MARQGVQVRDRGWRRIQTSARQARREPYAAIGILGDGSRQTDREDGNVTVLDKAVWNHFGVSATPYHPGIPERPFIRDAVEANRGELERTGARMLRLVLTGKATPRHMLNLAGVQITGMVRKYVREGGNLEPNAEATLEAKTRAGNVGDTPLIDTGQLMGAVTHEVRD